MVSAVVVPSGAAVLFADAEQPFFDHAALSNWSEYVRAFGPLSVSAQREYDDHDTEKKSPAVCPDVTVSTIPTLRAPEDFGTYAYVDNPSDIALETNPSVASSRD
jgi:hypothetical protein